MGRVQGDAKELYTRKLLANVKGIGTMLGAEETTRRAEAIVAFSAMVGALGLARAVSDAALSDEILAAVRDYLLSNFNGAAERNLE